MRTSTSSYLVQYVYQYQGFDSGIYSIVRGVYADLFEINLQSCRAADGELYSTYQYLIMLVVDVFFDYFAIW